MSLYPVSCSTTTKARVSLFKGGLIFLAACVVIGHIIERLLSPVLPSYELMSGFSLAGLLANGVCLLLLWRHRQEDINMSPVYECSRNDIAANVSVMFAALGVWTFESALPDIIMRIGTVTVITALDEFLEQQRLPGAGVSGPHPRVPGEDCLSGIPVTAFHDG